MRTRLPEGFFFRAHRVERGDRRPTGRKGAIPDRERVGEPAPEEGGTEAAIVDRVIERRRRDGKNRPGSEMRRSERLAQYGLPGGVRTPARSANRASRPFGSGIGRRNPTAAQTSSHHSIQCC